MSKKFYTLFWDADADFSILPDEKLLAAYQDCSALCREMTSNLDDWNEVDLWEQVSLEAALQSELGGEQS